MGHVHHRAFGDDHRQGGKRASRKGEGGPRGVPGGVRAACSSSKRWGPQGGGGGGASMGEGLVRGDPCLLVPNASRQEAEANFALSFSFNVRLCIITIKGTVSL